MLLGFGVPSLPFFLLAPRAFVHDIVFAQLHRKTTGQGFHSVGDRLVLMLGLSKSSGEPAKAHLAEIIALLLLALVVAVYFIPKRKPSRLEWFVLVATGVIVAAMLFVLKEFYEFYAYFAVAFGVMLMGICFGRVADGIAWMGEQVSGARGRALAMTSSVGAPVAVVIAAAVILPSGTSYARPFLSGAYDPKPTIRSFSCTACGRWF